MNQPYRPDPRRRRVRIVALVVVASMVGTVLASTLAAILS